MHEVPDLPYEYEALEPHIDARTMKIHHTKHHAAYVSNLNKALEGKPDLEAKTVEDLLLGIAGIPEAIRGAVRNHGGGHANHTLFWTVMGPGGGGEPGGSLAEAIERDLGGFNAMKEAFSAAAISQFGSGWGWLALGESGKLEVFSLPNQDSPLMQQKTPILGLDVWEHAYYLNYQNRRGDYVAAWWNVVDWKAVASRYEAAV